MDRDKPARFTTIVVRPGGLQPEQRTLVGPVRSLREVGAAMGISTERVRQVENEALAEIDRRLRRLVGEPFTPRRVVQWLTDTGVPSGDDPLELPGGGRDRVAARAEAKRIAKEMDG